MAEETEAKVLARPVYLDGELVPAGTKLSAGQAEKITNPKAFIAEPTLADKVKASEDAYARAVVAEEAAEAARPKDTSAVRADRADDGAAFARAAKAAGAKPAPPAKH